MSIDFASLATGALGFTIALAWNDAASKTIRSFFPRDGGRAAAHVALLYALVVTILVIIVVAVIVHTRRLVHKFSGAADAQKPETLPAGSREHLDRRWRPPVVARPIVQLHSREERAAVSGAHYMRAG
jgi:hypothetical protein